MDGPRHEPGTYADLDQAQTLAAVRAEGWEPDVFADPPGAVYPPHRHPEAKLLAFLAGSMEVQVAGRAYRCRPGDKLEHAARVGPAGCTFVWSEQVRDLG